MTESPPVSPRPTPQRVPFGPVDIQFDDTVLVPRPWTLAQSTWGRQLLEVAPGGPVLELCSGAGHIGLATVHGTGRTLVQVDQDAHACDLARLNAAEAGVDSDVRCGDLTEVVGEGEQFVLVVADPPWVTTQDVPVFPADPVWAIDGGEDGLDIARRCVAVAAAHLAGDGLVLLQLGSAEQVASLAWSLDRVGLACVDVRSYDGGAIALLARR